MGVEPCLGTDGNLYNRATLQRQPTVDGQPASVRVSPMTNSRKEPIWILDTLGFVRNAQKRIMSCDTRLWHKFLRSDRAFPDKDTLEEEILFKMRYTPVGACPNGNGTQEEEALYTRLRGERQARIDEQAEQERQDQEAMNAEMARRMGQHPALQQMAEMLGAFQRQMSTLAQNMEMHVSIMFGNTPGSDSPTSGSRRLSAAEERSQC